MVKPFGATHCAKRSTEEILNVARSIPSLLSGPPGSTITVGLRRSKVVPHEELRIEQQFDLGSDQVLQHLSPVLKQRMKTVKPRRGTS